MSDTALLYDGKVRLSFKGGSGARYVAEDTERGVILNPPSVTQILGLLDKPALIYWAANSTCDYLRERILPGKSYDEIQLGQMFDDARYNFRRVSKTAVGVGQLAHAWIECLLTRQLVGNSELPDLPVNIPAQNACKAAQKWIFENKYEPLKPEERLYSRKHNIAGTMDFPATVGGELSIVDWKTTKRAQNSLGLYDEMILQVSTYAVIYEEMTGKRVKHTWIVRIDKETGVPEAVCLEEHWKKQGLNPRTERRENFKAVLALKAVYERMQTIKNGGKATTDLQGALEKSLKGRAA